MADHPGVVTELVDSATQTDVTLRPSALVSFVTAGGERTTAWEPPTFGAPVTKPVETPRRPAAIDPKSPFLPIGRLSPTESDGFKTPTRPTTAAPNPLMSASTLQSLSPLVPAPKMPSIDVDGPRAEQSQQPEQPRPFAAAAPPPFASTAPPQAWTSSARPAGGAAPSWNLPNLYPLTVAWVPMPVSPALTNLVSLYRRRVQQRLAASRYPVFH